MCVDAHVVNDLGMGQDERAIWPGGGCGCADQPTTFDATLVCTYSRTDGTFTSRAMRYRWLGWPGSQINRPIPPLCDLSQVSTPLVCCFSRKHLPLLLSTCQLSVNATIRFIHCPAARNQNLSLLKKDRLHHLTATIPRTRRTTGNKTSTTTPTNSKPSFGQVLAGKKYHKYIHPSPPRADHTERIRRFEPDAGQRTAVSFACLCARVSSKLNHRRMPKVKPPRG